MENIYATDFIYDGRRLSEFGFIVCSFDQSGGAKTAEKGSEVTFQLQPIGLGQRYAVTGTKYDNRLSTSFEICKDPEKFEGLDMNIKNEEFRELSRWLNRRRFLWFHAFDVCEPDVILPWFRAAFTLKRILVGGSTVGIQLDMQTDSPFGYGEEIEESFSFTAENMTNIIVDKNEEVGTTWPEAVIICNESGELKLTNEMTGCIFRVRNCTTGEIVTQYGDTKIIESRKKIRNLLLLPGSEDYVAGASNVHGGWKYTIGDDGSITMSASGGA